MNTIVTQVDYEIAITIVWEGIEYCVDLDEFFAIQDRLHGMSLILPSDSEMAQELRWLMAIVKERLHMVKPHLKKDEQIRSNVINLHGDSGGGS